MSAGKKKKGAKRFFSFLAKVLAVVLVYEAAVWFVSVFCFACSFLV